MSTLARLVKWALFSTNILFALVGIALLTYGLVMLHWSSLHSDNFRTFFDAVPMSLIITGSIIIAVAALGFVVILRSWYYFLIVYCVLVGVLISLQLGGILYTYLYREELREKVSKKLVYSFDKYNKDPNITTYWNNMHKKLKCCGLNGKEDFDSQPLPKSCCPPEINKVCSSKYYYGRGCQEAILGVPHEYRIFFYVVGGLILALELLLVYLTACFLWAMNNDYEIV